MSQPLPVDELLHTTFVVEDYRAVIEHYTRFFGIGRWEVRTFDARNLADARFEGRPVEHSFVSVLGRNGDIGVELIEPLEGDSAYRAMLESVGPGICSSLVSACPAEAFEAAHPTLEALGIGIRQAGSIGGVLDYYLLDTRERLANLGLEVVCPRSDDWLGEVPPETVIEEDPADFGGPFLPLQRMYHVGVVCRDRDAVKDGLTRLLGMQHWLEFHIEAGVTMEECTFYGREVFHQYDNHIGRAGGVCFELIQSASDNNVYQEFLDQRGEGMHHIFPSICPRDAFEAAREAFAAAEVPIIQSGRIGDLMYYCYFDTRRYLPGVTTEVVVPLRDDWLAVMFPDADDRFVLTGERD